MSAQCEGRAHQKAGVCSGSCPINMSSMSTGIRERIRLNTGWPLSHNPCGVVLRRRLRGARRFASCSTERTVRRFASHAPRGRSALRFFRPCRSIDDVPTLASEPPDRPASRSRWHVRVSSVPFLRTRNPTKCKESSQCRVDGSAAQHSQTETSCRRPGLHDQHGFLSIRSVAWYPHAAALFAISCPATYCKTPSVAVRY